MASHQRFCDDNYKNWLKTVESLSILRRGLQKFVENETETFHESLKEILKEENCESECYFKKSFKESVLCDKCKSWKENISSNHTVEGSWKHWNNCIPHLWPKEKWEVAKVFMPGGHKDHQKFEQFDISAILNFMLYCKHFKGFDKNLLTKIIQVRNQVMHSPDFRLPKKDMDEGIKNVLEFSEILEPKAQELRTIAEEIKKFNSVLDQYTQIGAQDTADCKDASEINLLEREQQALKEKIEFLVQNNQHEDQHRKIKEELEGIKNFLEQNKDVLENLGPHVTRLDEIKKKVGQHEQQIDEVKDRMNQLEEGTKGISLNIPQVNGLQIGNNNIMSICSSGRCSHLENSQTTNTELKEILDKYEDHTITNAHLALIQENLGAKWKDCARKLGLTDVEIDRIDHDYKCDGLAEKVHQMLRCWKMKEGLLGYTVGKLCRALGNCVNQDVLCTLLLKSQDPTAL